MRIVFRYYHDLSVSYTNFFIGNKSFYIDQIGVAHQHITTYERYKNAFHHEITVNVEV
jgi:hypothetical protein